MKFLAFSAGLGLALGVGLTSCRGPDLEFDCVFYGEAFDGAIRDDGILYSEVGQASPYPAALLLSEDGINKLLNSVVDQDVPFTGSIPFGPANVDFEPTSSPVIEFASLPGCSACVLFAIDFRVKLTQGGDAISSGLGNVKMRIPLRIEEAEDGLSAVLIAGYDEAVIEEMFLEVFGFNSDEHEALAGALEILMTEQINMEFGPTNILTLASWQLGEGDIRLLARRLLVFPEHKSMAIALQSNLWLGEDGPSLEITGEMERNAPMALEFDTALLDGLIRRMLVDGTVDRYYNEDGNPDPNGNYAVSLCHEERTDDELGFCQKDGITGEPPGRLEARFLVWRTDNGYCGNVEVSLPIDATLEVVSDNVIYPQSAVAFAPQSPILVRGRGAGTIAEDPDAEEEFLEEQVELVDNFTSSLANLLSESINYDGLALDGKNVLFTTTAAVVAEEKIITDLDFLVLDQPTEEGE